MSAEFADTTVVLYPIDDGPNAERTVEILGQGPRASAQVLTEAMVNCRRKTRLSQEDTGALLDGMKSLWPFVDITVQTHQVGRELAEKYEQSVYDTMFMSAALIAGCTTLWSENFHNTLLIESRLSAVNQLS